MPRSTTTSASRSSGENDDSVKKRRGRTAKPSASAAETEAPPAKSHGERGGSEEHAAETPKSTSRPEPTSPPEPRQHEYRQPEPRGDGPSRQAEKPPTPPGNSSPSWPSNIGGPGTATTAPRPPQPSQGYPGSYGGQPRHGQDSQMPFTNSQGSSSQGQSAPAPSHGYQGGHSPGGYQQRENNNAQGHGVQSPSSFQQRSFSGQSMPGQQGMPGQGGRRKKKKKRGGGGMPGMPGMPGHSGGSGGGGGGGGGAVHQMIAAGFLPSDEEIEREAQALERIAATGEYAEAEKKALHMSELQRMEIGKLHQFATREGLVEFHKLPRQELIFQLLRKKAGETGLIFGEGTLDVSQDGYGFLRSPEQSYLASPDDIYVSPSMVRRNGLRKGMEIKGAIRPPKDNERYFTLLRIDNVNGHEPQRARQLPIFEDLTPLHPEQRFVLETEPDQIEMRIVDLVAPIGRGQRGLIVAPPRTGKTVLLQKITQAISKNYPEVKIIVLLIDERPEEVTDFRRNTTKDVEVVASTFDEDSSRHVAVAEMVIEKARRYVEYGQHVVILLDSITRLARAYNAAQPHSGKIMTGGIDSNALVRPKKFFGSARAIENGGSLTILGTALVDTGSKADEVIFEEFKGTGNSELHLDRKLVDKRIWPAIDVAASGTRREELLLDRKELELTYRLRKVLADMNVVEAMELMKSRLKKAKTNAEFLMTMNIGA